MFRTRQIELDSLTFLQYNNGISELVYHESSDRAVKDFFYIVDMVIRETPPNKKIYILSDLSKTGSLPLAEHYSQISKLNTNYDPVTRPFARFANLYNDVSLKRKLVLAYMRSLEMPKVELEMFAIEERERAIRWLLRDS